MPARTQFGNTWWGQKWLDALRGIDYDNRLPRGKSYARNGSVVDIQISRNRIHARVQGRRRTPYQEEILLKPFTDEERAAILRVMTQNPYYLSRLLNRELPTELLNELTRLKIQLFPKAWSDLQASCSCPDWAVPCKHLAAVIYIIANEIDKNPFLIFELHDLDILKELENLGYHASPGRTKGILSMQQILKNAAGLPPGKAAIALPEKFLAGFDFSRIPLLWPELVAVLSDKPLFILTEDFKKTLMRVYKKVTRKTESFLEFGLESLYSASPTKSRQLSEKTGFNANPESVDDIDFKIADDFRFKKGKLIGRKQKISFTSTELRPLIEFLHQIPADRLADFPPKIALFHLVYRFSLALLKKGAFIPELLEISQNEYTLRWIPALLDPTVRGFSEKFLEFLPTDSVALMKEVPALTRTKGKKPERHFVRKYPERKQQFLFLTSLFLNYFVWKFAEDLASGDPIRRLFFGHSKLILRGFEDREIPSTIQLWLSRLTLSDRTVVPVLKIEELPEGFEVHVLVKERTESLQEPLPLKEFFKNDAYAEKRVSVLKDLALLSDFFPDIRDVIASSGERPVFVSLGDFPVVFFQILPVLQLLGIQVLLPKALHTLIRPRLSLSLERTSEAANAVHFLSLEKMLQFNWKVALGDRLISVEEFEELVRGKSGIVRIRDQFVYLDEKDIQAILNQAQKPPELGSADLLKIGLEEKFEGARVKLSPQSREVFHQLLETRAVPLPKNLHGVLRDYQKRGYQWLIRNAVVGFGSILADDMGLGKTIQVIAVLLKLKNENQLNKKALIIVPTTLLTNWRKEIERFAPDLRTSIYHGTDRKLDLDNFDVILTTYGIIRNENKKFTQHIWKVVVIDEAQNIKNPSTGQTRAVKKIKADIRIAMTGTPVENRLLEYWSIFDFTNRGYLGGMKYFKEQFAFPIEVFRNQRKLNRLLKLTRPFILRRLKTDKSIIQDLPEKLEFDQYCSLTKEQTALYQNVVNENLDQIKQRDGISRRGMIFKLMTALKQICNHPSHFLKEKKIDPSLSGKTSMLLDLLENFYAGDEKVLIFTQYKEMGELLFQMIKDQFGMEVPFLHGGVLRKKRDEMVDLFQNEKRVRTMILSLKAGGTGLNLTAAKNVVHFDLWWNPAVESQATDRAYRIGQTKDVMVYRFITQGTFEEKINDMLQKKKELAELAISKGEKWIGELSDKELAEIVRLD